MGEKRERDWVHNLRKNDSPVIRWLVTDQHCQVELQRWAAINESRIQIDLFVPMLLRPRR